jgi:CcmD family protein
MAYLAGAYLVLWAILFGYVFSLHRRQRQLERELHSLCAAELAQPREGEGEG